jgi:hypothetical protein
MSSNILALFDVDGTLTPPRGPISPPVRSFLTELQGRVTVGIVGGSDLPKQREQLGDDVLDRCAAGSQPVKRTTPIDGNPFLSPPPPSPAPAGTSGTSLRTVSWRTAPGLC